MTEHFSSGGRLGRMLVKSVLVVLSVAQSACLSVDVDERRSQQGADDSEPQTSNAAIDSVLGRTLQSIPAIELDGDTATIALSDGAPTVLIVATEQDYLSCLNLVYEAWESRRFVTPMEGDVVILARADSGSVVREYAQTHRLPSTPLLDTADVIVERVRTSASPLLLLVNGQGEIEAAYRRAPIDARRSPLPTILDDSLMAGG